MNNYRVEQTLLCSALYTISKLNENIYVRVCECKCAEVISTGMARRCVDRMRNRALRSELDKYLHPPYTRVYTRDSTKTKISNT